MLLTKFFKTQLNNLINAELKMIATINNFLTYKVPTTIERSTHNAGGMIYKTHVVMSDGQNLLISDAQHGNGVYKIDETLVFTCDESGNINSWTEVAGSRNARTDEIVCELNKYGYRKICGDDS